MYNRRSQGWLKHIDFILWDVVALQIAFLLAYMIRQGGAIPYVADSYRAFVILMAFVDILVAAAFNTMHNVMRRGLYNEFVQTLKQVVLVLLIMALFMFLTRRGTEYSRFTLLISAIFHLFLGYGIRLWWKKVIRKRGSKKPAKRMILVADERQVPEILSKLSEADGKQYCGLVLSNRNGEGETIAGLQVVANVSNAADYICREWVDELFVYPRTLTELEGTESILYKSVEGFMHDTFTNYYKTDYQAAGDKEDEGSERSDRPDKASIANLIEQCRQMLIPVHIRLPMANIGGKTFVEKINGYNVLTTAVNYASTLQAAMKRTLDIIGGIFGSIVALIIMAVYGPKIKKESPGPIIFKQTRIGKNGKKFEIYKIRTMYMDAEERKAELMKDNRISDGYMFKMDWDPRIIGNKIVDGKQVTGLGEKLRSSSLDEWPQFFNVLRGQMSLVGTRPPTVDEWEKYKYHHRARLSIKPGITGLWQVSGRSKITDFDEVVKLDTEYIDNWSMGLDFRILLRTVKQVKNKEGAM